jgi:hypothetical protein
MTFAFYFAELHSLEAACDDRSPALVWVQHSPEFDFLHSDERYRAINSRISPRRGSKIMRSNWNLCRSLSLLSILIVDAGTVWRLSMRYDWLKGLICGTPSLLNCLPLTVLTEFLRR